MRFIKPSEISSKIMTLIEESDEYVILVSPYVKITKWYKLLKKIDNLNRRQIPISLIIRDDRTNQTSFEELNELGYKYTAIKDLHCKLYLNEKYAIVSSMNLLLSSEINSLEIAYQTETETELNELREFCKRYLYIDFSGSSSAKYEGDWSDSVCGAISEIIGRKVNARQDNETFLLNTGSNNYTAFIWNSKKNMLRISGILSGDEFDFLSKNQQNIPKIEGFKVELQKGGNGYYDTIWGTLEISLKSADLNYVLDIEKSIIAEKVVNFILEVEGFKNGKGITLQKR